MNIAELIQGEASLRPEGIATVMPKKNLLGDFTYSHLTFLELEKRIETYAYYLTKKGFRHGDRALLFIKPCLEFHALVFALFRSGIIPVLIDPGMGKKNLLKAIEKTKPRGMIAESVVFWLKKLYSKSFSTIEIEVKKSEINLWSKDTKEYPLFNPNPESLAAILFTSGGTGTPKGVEYSHKILVEQTRLLKEMFSLTIEDRDLPGFPLFSLFTLAMGMQSCVPWMNPSKPSTCDPKYLVKNILDTKATFLAGSPAIWERVAEYCLKENIKLEFVKSLVMFGAPVRTELHRKFSSILTNGTTYTPYGATEALPVTCVSGKEILERHSIKTSEGAGTCVGKNINGCEIKIIPTQDEVIPFLNNTKILSPYERGEIIVKGATVTAKYFEEKEATSKAKIFDDTQSGEFWHRMGDLGYLDEEGHLWFCGRKDHRVETGKLTLYSVNCEAIFNQHPLVKRSALIGIGERFNQGPALVVEPKIKLFSSKKDQMREELLSLGQNFSHTAGIKKIYFAKKFPVDVRHNIKIDRLKLKKWAQEGRL